MRKLLRITVIAFGSLLLLCVLAGWFLTAEPGENMLRGWLESQITAEVGLPVSIGSFETNLFSRVQLDTVVVFTSDESDAAATLFVGHLRVQYSIPDLVGDQTRLRLIEVDSVALALAFDSLGRSGIPLLDDPTSDAAESDKPSSLIVIDSVSVSRIGVSYRDIQLPLLAEASGVTVSASGGTDGSYSGRVSVSSTAIAYDSLMLGVSGIEIAATLIDESVRLDYAKADCEGLTIDVSGNINLSDSPELSLAVVIEGAIDRAASVLDSLYGDLPVTSGFVNAALGLEGTIDDPLVSFDVDFREMVSPDLTIDSGSVSGRYAGGEIDLSEMQVGMLGGTIAAKGSTVLDSLGATQIEMTLDGLLLSNIWRAVYSEGSPYRGKLHGSITAAGPVSDWTLWAADANLKGENLQYNGRRAPDLTCSADLDSGRAILSLAHGVDEVRADLKLFADSLSGEFTVSVPDLTALARFIDQPDLSGTLHAGGTIGGLFANPTIGASISGTRIEYRYFPVDSLTAELSYSDSQLTVLKLACKGMLDSIDTEHPPFDLDSISGSLAYECEFSGPLDELEGEIYANMVAPGYAQYSLDSVALEVLLHGSRIEVTRLDACLDDIGARLEASFDTMSSVGAFEMMLKPLGDSAHSETEPIPDLTLARDHFGSIRGQFSLESDSQLRADIHGDRLWLGLIPMLYDDSLEIGGEAAFDLEVHGPYLTPNAELEVRISSLEIADQRVDSIFTYVRLNPQALTLDSLNSYALGQTLRASGQLDLSVAKRGSYEIPQDGTLQAALSTTDFDLAVFEDILLPEGEIAGKVSAALLVSGSTSSPAFDGWLMLDEGSVLLDESSPPLDSIAISLSFIDTVLTIDSASSTISGVSIRASGSLTTSRFESALVDLAVAVGQFGRIAISGVVSDKELHLDLTSDTLNLAVFQPFLPSVDSLAGRLNAQVGVRGDPISPEFDGHMSLTAAAFHAPNKYVRAADGCAEVRFDRNHVLIDSLSAMINGGRLFLTGVVSHDQGELTDVGLELHASKVRYEQPGTFIVIVDSAALKYGRQHDNFVLDGDIVLGESRVVKGLGATAVLPWIQSFETVDMELPDLIARSRLNVRVRESDNLWVDNNLARLRLRAEIGVIGTPLRPNFTGMVRVEEGYLLYLDRRFKVSEGSIYFTDPTRFNPDIKLDASTQITVYRRTAAEQYTVYIQAEGYLDQLRYGLFSEPALDRPDIVALLTIGATRSEMTKSGDNNGGNGLTQVLKDRAAMLTSQRVSRYISRKAGAVFGFDEFSIQGNLFQFDDSWGPQLVASKRISRRVDLTYSTTVGHLNDQSVRLGYRLTSRWSLMGETDRQGRSGLDLKYGITFK